jgi:sec-independent protein translocase protein TatC
MPLREHLREARRRFLSAVVAVAVGSVIGWLTFDRVFAALQQPILAADAAGRTAALNFEGIATSFDIRLRVSVFVGILLASPWWLYQAWAFVAPGLTPRERRASLAYAAAAVPLFLGGAAAAWLFLPHAVTLLTGFTPTGAVNFINASVYLGFVMQLVLAFGLAALLPLVMVALTALRLVRARTWARGWRWAVLLIFVFAAIATPTPDAISMVVLALPICALYAGALGVCTLLDRRAAQRAAAATDAAPEAGGALPGEAAQGGWPA